MGDNGHAFSEHGLIDKRTAYEESMRVPMLVHCPELVKGGQRMTPMVANIDVAPTLLETAGLEPPSGLDGKSFRPLVQGKAVPWRSDLLYGYFWERNLPMVPTLHAVRGERNKFVRVQGLWDTDELYDLKDDPAEARNLIDSRDHAVVARTMRRRLFEVLGETDEMQVPLAPDRGA